MLARLFRAPLSAALALCAMGGAAAPAFAATEPKPPTNICINDKCTTPKPPTAGGIKWHPGHYTWLGGLILSDEIMSGWFSKIDTLCDDPYIKGVQIYITWAALEPTKGNYAGSFAKVDKLIDKLAKCKKKLMLGIDEREFGPVAKPGATPNPAWYDWIYPTYLTRESEYGTKWLKGVVFQENGEWVSTLKSTPRLWDPKVMDRLIALVRAMGARYDTNPTLEQFYLETISMSDAALKADNASYDDFYKQYKRLLGAASAAFPHTIVHTKADWVRSITYAKDIIGYCISLPNCAMGQNDPEVPLPNVKGQGNYRGQLISTVFRGLDGGDEDHRGKIAWTSEVQEMGLGERGFSYTPAQLNEFFHDYVRASHQVWLYNNYLGTPEQRWATGIKPFIASIKGKVYATACPTRYASCNTN